MEGRTKHLCMINPKTLQLGNWLLGANGELQQVDYIGETIGLKNKSGGTDKYQHDPLFSYDIKDLKGIPLTPEILEKCGFNLKPHRQSIWYRKRLQIALGNGALPYLLTEDQEQAVYIPTTLEFLHQLQNLFFSLYGEELTINL